MIFIKLKKSIDMSYIIRKSQIEDKLDIQNAHRRSIRELCSKDYGAKEIEAWSSVIYTDDVFTNSVKNDCHIVIEINNTIEGFCHARFHEDGLGEIMGLFLTPEVSGFGAGRAAFEKAIEYLKECDVNRVVITGTRTAKGFYERMGFKAVSEEKLFDIRGEKIACYEMEMKI
jgi:putative acetyltransferase